MARTRKPKRVKLTARELSLLQHPPTPKTWLCKEGHVNSGSKEECGYCHQSKPARPKKLWPDYVAVCAKIGIEPGSAKVMKIDAHTLAFFPKGGKGWEKKAWPIS